jgi:tetratricopeptide (TPR) repeat protein
MAEGMLGGILGDEDEKREVEAPDALAGAEAFASAVVAKLAGNDPEVARKTVEFLGKQSQLLETQNKHLEEDHAARLHYLRGQAREVDIRRFALRLRIGLQIFLVLVATAVGIGALIFIRDAIEDHGLVVEAFSVPPDLAGNGLTGEVVATRFLDKLQAMQTATTSERPADSYQYNWGSDIKVEIPETGLSLREFSKLLRDRFGHANHITGEVIRTPTGIAVTARFGDAAPATFTGPESDFDELAREAAEAVYRTSQPYRFSQFLFQHGRNAESLDVISDLATNGPLTEQGWAYTLWGTLDVNVSADLDSARKHCSKGLSYSGASTVPAEICLVGAESWSGHDEKAFQYSVPLELHSQENSPGISKVFFESNRLIAQGWLETITGDLQKSAKDWTLVESAPEFLGSARLAPALAASAYALNHDPEAGRKIAATLEPNDDRSLLKLDAIWAFSALPDYWIAAAGDDWPAALTDAKACDAWLDAHAPIDKLFGQLRAVWIQPLVALAMAKTGDVAGAEVLISATPLDCYLCVRIRAQIASIHRDWSSAERWFAEAVRQAPSLPFAYSEWGDMQLSKGDTNSALTKFAGAHLRGPHFADPLKGWGDALARQGQWSSALAKYDEALVYAPNWKELKAAREAVAKQKS